MIKYVCSDKILKPGQVRNKPGICFQKGVAAGFRAAMMKIEKIQRVRGIKPIVPRITILERPVRLRPVQKPTLPSLKELEKQMKEALIAKGLPNQPNDNLAKIYMSLNPNSGKSYSEIRNRIPNKDLRRELIEKKLARV